MKYCSHCGAPVRFAVPHGDHKSRAICDACNTVHYENPRMIVGCLPFLEDKVLLCKRANEPRRGLWTLPAGFLEHGETVEEGAMRETLEEANARVEEPELFSVYSIPGIGQIYLFFTARLRDLDFHPGTETEEMALFTQADIPWRELAFSSVRYTLEMYFEHRLSSHRIVHVGSFSNDPRPVY